MADGYSNSRRPRASIVVVSYNTSEHIEACLNSLLDLDYPHVEIIVIDNASTDGSVDMIRRRFPQKEFPQIEVEQLPSNKGFAGGASVGLYMASGEIVATVNPDVILDRDWLSVVTSTLLSNDDIGIVGSKILYLDRRTIQHAGGVVHYPLATTDHIGRGEHDKGQYDQAREVSFVTGAALAMRRDIGRSLSFFDEEYFPMYYEDVDLCWRARADGLRVVYEPAAVAYHKESVTVDRTSQRYYSYFHANRLRFVVKHYSPQQVLLDFLPAEAVRVVGDMEEDDRKASFAILNNSPPDSHEKKAMTAALEQRWDELHRQLQEVLEGWQVYEKSRPSKPAKGLQGRISNLFSRFYTWPVLQKQLDYNASIARSLREISKQMEDLQARVALQSLLTAAVMSRENTASGNIYAELEALRGRIDQMQSAEIDSHTQYGRSRAN